MKKFTLFLIGFLLITNTIIIFAAPAVFVPFKCPPGSPEKDGWYVYEDRNGNGYYDRVTTKHCDGSITVHDIPDIIGGFKDTIGTAPFYTNSVVYDFSTFTCDGGTKPAWQVIAKDSISLEEIYRIVGCGNTYQLIIPGITTTISGYTINSFTLSELIRVFPNPAQDLLNIKILEPLFGNLLIDIVYSQGDIIKSVEVQMDGNSDFSINISEFASGNYFIKLVYGTSLCIIPLGIIR